MAQEIPRLVDHLFRREAGKMVSYLTKLFGLNNLSLAEDVVQDTLCRALETWKFHGLPDNPSAWLMRAARNRAIDIIRREQNFRTFMPDLAYFVKLQESLLPDGEKLVFDKEIQDDQLRLMFACCSPALSPDLQVTLILKTLCGFGVEEIASALLVGADSIEKRLSRAKKVFQASGALEEVEGIPELQSRLQAIYDSIYLLFNEGYNGSQSEFMVREDLCYEALRLALLLSEHPAGRSPKTYALVALMCFHAARLTGRMDAEGCLILLEAQDRSQWNKELIGKGFEYLEMAAKGGEISEYHLEAGIASLHCMAESYEKTNWAEILKIYDLLYQMKPTPIVALNRAIARGQAKGPEEGLAALKGIDGLEKLKDYPFYPAALGEFHRLAGRDKEAGEYFGKALQLARGPSETKFLERKLKACGWDHREISWGPKV
jgi:RNA polymerase sigma factor (sigma-70 family)